MNKFKFISDPGHGWLKVPRHLLNEYGISSKISEYSYQSYNDVYLEEDCDASLFVTEHEKRTGLPIEIEYQNCQRDSLIRRCARYNTN